MKLLAALLSTSSATLLGTCASNFSECQRVTITTTLCFDREDATMDTPDETLEADFAALDIFNGQSGFVSSTFDVTSIDDGTAGASPDVTIVDTKGVEGDATWFAFSFTDKVVEKVIICGNVATVFEEQPGEATLNESEWETKVNGDITAALVNPAVSGTAISAELITVPTTTTTTTTTTTAATTTAATTTVVTTTTKDVTTTAGGTDWETICKAPDQNLVNLFNLARGGWKVAKTYFSGERSSIIRVNVKKRPAATKYNGAAFFSRKYCGNDFLSKLADGTVQYDIMEKVPGAYNNIHGFYKQETDKDKRNQSAFVIQWSNLAVADNEGTNKKDRLYLQLIGLEHVKWGKNKKEECLESKLVVVNMDYSDQDHTPCLAWQRTVGRLAVLQK